MADMRKLAETLAALSESANTQQAKPIVEGSMLKSLEMLSKASAPTRRLAEEYEQFKEEAKYEHPSHTTGHKVIKKTAHDLQNPPKVMQHRAKRDQERDSHWMATQIAKNEVDETIVKTGSEYELKSHTGKNLGKYPTKAGAEKREKQVNYFKHKNEGVNEAGFPHDVDHMPGATIKNPQTACKRCNGHGTVWKSPEGKLLPANDVPGAKRYKCGACKGLGFVKRVEEAMPTPVATGATAPKSPAAPSASAPSAPTTPGQAAKPDPKVLAVQKQVQKQNLDKLQDTDPATQAQDMQLSKTVPQSDKDKMISTMSQMLQDPKAAAELQKLQKLAGVNSKVQGQ